MKMFAAFAVLSAGLLGTPAMAQAPGPVSAAPSVRSPLSGGLVMAPQAVMRHGSGMRATAGAAEGPGLPPPPPSKGPQFRLRSGMLQLEILCGENSAVKDCAEASTALMDHFAAMSAGASAPSPQAADAPPAASAEDEAASDAASTQ